MLFIEVRRNLSKKAQVGLLFAGVLLIAFLCVQFPRRNIKTESDESFISRFLRNSKHLNRQAVKKILDSDRPYPFAFAVIGDPHVGTSKGEAVFGQLIDALKKDPPAFLVVNGDLTDVYSDANLAKYLNMTGGLGVPVISVIGNHDISDFGAYLKTFGETDFYFDYRDYRFIFLNDSSGKSAIGGLKSSQLLWLKEKLNTPRYPFIFMHIPPRVTGAERLEALNNNYVSHPYRGAFFESPPGIDNLEAFEAIIRARAPLTVISSHIHCFADYSKDGVRYIVTGGGGGILNEEWNNGLKPPEEGMFYHLVKITLVSGNTYQGEVVSLKGEKKDYRFNSVNP